MAVTNLPSLRRFAAPWDIIPNSPTVCIFADTQWAHLLRNRLQVQIWVSVLWSCLCIRFLFCVFPPPNFFHWSLVKNARAPKMGRNLKIVAEAASTDPQGVQVKTVEGKEGNFLQCTWWSITSWPLFWNATCENSLVIDAVWFSGVVSNGQALPTAVSENPGSGAGTAAASLASSDGYHGWNKPNINPFLSITVLGATGDLARNKIFPALFALYYSGHLYKVCINNCSSRNAANVYNFALLVDTTKILIEIWHMDSVQSLYPPQKSCEFLVWNSLRKQLDTSTG